MSQAFCGRLYNTHESVHIYITIATFVILLKNMHYMVIYAQKMIEYLRC